MVDTETIYWSFSDLCGRYFSNILCGGFLIIDEICGCINFLGVIIRRSETFRFDIAILSTKTLPQRVIGILIVVDVVRVVVRIS